MRSLSLLSLVVVLLIVAVLVKKQLGTVQPVAPAAPVASDTLAVPNVSTPQQARQLPQQVQTDVNSMMQNRSGQLDQELENKQP
jgi:outer membrane receptor protein involved in Fe transport